MSRFEKTYCSQCGGEFGPGDEGYSHCEDHTKPPHCLPIPVNRNQGWPGIYAVLYTDEINGEQTGRDDLWIATTQAIDRAQREAYAEGRADERETIAQLCDEEAAEMRRQGEGCRDGRYDWMADGVEALADALRGISSATGQPADPVLAAGWLPIEFAPEDENVLVATEGGHVDTAFWTDDDGEGRKWWWLVSANEYAKHPLHPNLTPLYWMPLPKHPHRVATTIGKTR